MRKLGNLLDGFKSHFADLRAEREAHAAEIAQATEFARQSFERKLTTGLGEHLERCGVPDRIAETLASSELQETEAWKAVDRFLASDRNILVMTGGVGTGKSVAAASVLRRAVSMHEHWPHRLSDEPLRVQVLDAKRGMFVRASALAAFTDEAKELLEDAIAVRWLVLDDLGTEVKDPQGWWMQKLDRLIDERHQGKKLRTVITTNLPSKALFERYEPRIRDRILDSGLVVGTGLVSLRGRKAGAA